MQHLVFRRVCNPNVTIGGNTHALQSADLSGEGEVGFAPDRATVEIHHAKRAVETGDPDVIEGHAGSPADAIDTHAGKPRNRGRQRLPAGRELDRAAADVVKDSSLRARHPVHATPQVAVRIETELA